MTTVTSSRRFQRPDLPAWMPRLERIEQSEASGPQGLGIVPSVLSLISIGLLVVLVQVALVSQFQHYMAQKHLYDELRLTLAEGSIPVGQTDVDGKIVKAGTPVALLKIPKLGIHEVVVEGSSSAETKSGVGHRRDTPLPGQAGVSVLMGRAASYGGVFAHLGDLKKGDLFWVTTGQGTSKYRVLGARTDSTELPALSGKDGRITLITATGGAFRPSGVLRVDAQLVTESFARPAPVIATGAVAATDEALAGDKTAALVLAWLLQLLVIIAVATVWAWKRWNRLATWIVFTPALVVVGFASADHMATMLPNLM